MQQILSEIYVRRFSRLISAYFNEEAYPKYNQSFDDFIAKNRNILSIEQNVYQSMGLLFMVSKVRILAIESIPIAKKLTKRVQFWVIVTSSSKHTSGQDGKWLISDLEYPWSV